jgi:hypothetical protein
MLDTITQYEQENNKHFNKGIAYANLGIAQIANGNLDEGIHHLLLADKDDAPFRVNPHGVLESILWKQFENRHIIARLMLLTTNSDASLHLRVDKAFILGFLGRMELPERLLLETTIWTIYRNLDFNRVNSNDYTRGRLHSGLKDICLLTETLLRKKQIADGIVPVNSLIMLGDRRGRPPGLLSNALSGHGIGYSANMLPTGANSLVEFLNNLEHILNASPSPEVRRIYCLHLVRNFTGHHFDVSSQVLSATGKEFFDLYEVTLSNILAAVLYLAHEALI